MYRCYFPMITIQEKTEHNLICSRTANIQDPHDLADINWADIVIFHRQHTKIALDCAKYCKMLGKKVMFEIDDNWFHLNDDNPFSETVKKDKNIIEGMLEFCRFADGVTVTNETLKKAMAEHIDHNKIHVVANYISDYFYRERTASQKKREGRVNLFWSGAQNHLYSIRLLVEPIQQIMQKYENVDFTMVGADYLSEFPFMKKARFFYVPWTDVESYPSAFELGDIAMAPLSEDAGFNQCKSNIRLQEAAWHGMPVVASNRYQYAKTVQHGKTGFLADNPADWVKYLSQLIENHEMRKEMSSQARKWAQTMTIENNYQKWIEVWERVLNG